MSICCSVRRWETGPTREDVNPDRTGDDKPSGGTNSHPARLSPRRLARLSRRSPWGEARVRGQLLPPAAAGAAAAAAAIFSGGGNVRGDAVGLSRLQPRPRLRLQGTEAAAAAAAAAPAGGRPTGRVGCRRHRWSRGQAVRQAVH